MEQKTVHPADIKASLEKCGNRPAKVARTLHLSKGHVSRVISGRDKNRRVAMAIADALGLTVDQLWPGRYETPAKSPNPSRRSRARKVA